MQDTWRKKLLELDRDLSSVMLLHIRFFFSFAYCECILHHDNTFVLLWKHNNVIFVVLGNTETTPNNSCHTSLDG